LADALRPTTRIFRMGEDVLYDFELNAGAPEPSADAIPQNTINEDTIAQDVLSRAELSRIR
jgi:hypothetical protein